MTPGEEAARRAIEAEAVDRARRRIELGKLDLMEACRECCHPWVRHHPDVDGHPCTVKRCGCRAFEDRPAGDGS